MADERLELDIVIKTAQSAQTVGEIKQSLNDINKELQKTEVGSSAFIKLTTEAGRLKGEMKELKEQIRNLDPGDRAKAIGRAVGGLANGFSAATAAAALFGNQSKQLQETLLKVQAAMAFANAIQGVMELGDAFKVLNAIIRANPIGAVITALTALVAIGAKVYDAFFSTRAQLQANVDLSEKLVELETKKLQHINDTENSLRLQGKSEKEILEMKIAQTDEIIAAREQQLKAQIELNKNQEETAKRGQEILENIIKFVTAPIRLLLYQIDLVGKAFGETFGTLDKFDKFSQNLIFDPEQTKRKGDETVKAMEEELDKLKNQRDGFHLSIQKIDDDAYKTQLEKQKEYLSQREKNEQDAFNQRIKDAAKREKDGKETRDNVLKEQETLEDEFLKRQDERRKKGEDDRKKQKDDDILKEKDLANARLSIQQSLFSSLASLGNIFLKNEEKAQKFKKAVAITELAVNTARAIAGAVAQAQIVPFPGNIAAIATGVATVLSNIAQAKALLSKAGGAGGAPTLDTGGFGSNSVSSGVNIQPVSQTSTLLNPDGTPVNNNQPQTIKAYVVETEMTATQKNIASIENKSKIG